MEKLFEARSGNPNLKFYRTGEGLAKTYRDCPSDYQMGPAIAALHPNRHPTQYQYRLPEEILPTKGILIMGSSKSATGYGMIHPNTINAAVLHR